MKWKMLLLIFILFFAAITRLIFLDRIPNAISGDEIIYSITAKSVALSGKDLSGTWSPLSALLFRYPPNERQAELPYFMVLPFVGPFPYSLLLARLPFAILSILTVFFIYLIAKELFKENIALICTALAAVNPWLTYIGRTGYETTPATFFYLVAFYCIIKLKGYKILFSIPFLLLAFYSYIGTKLLFIPFTLLVLIYTGIRTDWKDKKYLFTIGGTAILFLVFFLYALKGNAGESRTNEIFLPNSPIVTNTVNTWRKDVIVNPFGGLYLNKAFVYVWIIFGKVFAVLSPSYLFYEGDLFFSLWHGLFYIADAFFIPIGFYMLFKKKNREAILLTLCIIISLLPQIFHQNPENFSTHSALIVPFFIMIAAFGIYHFITLIKKSLYKKIAITSVICVYVLLVGNFFHIYFFRHPLQGYFDFPVRTLSWYMHLAKKQEVIVFSPTYKDIFKKYLFYENQITKETIPVIREQLKQSEEIAFKNVRFYPCTAFSNTQGKDTALVIIDAYCQNTSIDGDYSIKQMTDAGTLYKIANEKICNSYSFRSYPSEIKLSDFSFSSLSEERFCKTFIMKG